MATSERRGPFSDEPLNGLEVFWLAICALAGSKGDATEAEHQIRQAEDNRIVRYSLRLPHLNLSGADLSGAYLQHAELREVQLQHANLDRTQLQGADLISAQLQGANLSRARLERADLREALLDKQTRLGDTELTDVRIDSIIFDNTNLSVVSWSLMPQLQDERIARQKRYQEDYWESDQYGKRKNRHAREAEYQAAVRAYRLLAVALNAKGMSEERDGYTYRANIMQRKAYWYGGWHTRGKSFTSWSLAVVAGYGYRLWPIAATYGAIVILFAAGYFAAGQVRGQSMGTFQAALDALQISLNAIHGRVFFAQFGQDTAQSWLATIESIFGIGIEGVFVAMIIQRFFSK